jgi:predicted PurR-regulated permease PerM
MTDDRKPEAHDPDVPPSSSASPNPFHGDRLAPAFFLALLLATIAGLFYVLGMFIPDAIIAFILVALFRPLWTRLERRLHGRKWTASAIVTALIVVLVAAPVAFVLVTLGSETVNLVHRLRGAPGEGGAAAFQMLLGDRVESLLRAAHVPVSHARLVAVAAETRNWLATHALHETTVLLSSTLSLLFHFLLVVVMVFYLLVDADRLKAFAFALSPLPDDQDQMLVAKFAEVARGILVGSGIGSLLQGSIAGLAMYAVGLPSAVVWGTVMTLSAFVPLVGIHLVTVPAAIYLLMTGHAAKAIGFLAFAMAEGAFIENVVKTRLIGRSTRMHDLLILLSVLGGIAMFGMLGLLYGPLIVAAFLTLSELYFRVYERRIASALRREPSRSS